jgi:hypothetical protein
MWRDSPQWTRASSFTRFLDYHSRYGSSGRIIGRTQKPQPDNIQNSQQTDRHPCPSAGFEAAISAGERPQTYALDRAATGTGCLYEEVSTNTDLLGGWSRWKTQTYCSVHISDWNGRTMKNIRVTNSGMHFAYKVPIWFEVIKEFM